VYISPLDVDVYLLLSFHVVHLIGLIFDFITISFYYLSAVVNSSA